MPCDSELIGKKLKPTFEPSSQKKQTSTRHDGFCDAPVLNNLLINVCIGSELHIGGGEQHYTYFLQHKGLRAQKTGLHKAVQSKVHFSRVSRPMIRSLTENSTAPSSSCTYMYILVVKFT